VGKPIDGTRIILSQVLGERAIDPGARQREGNAGFGAKGSSMTTEEHGERHIALRAALHESGGGLERAHRYDAEPEHRGGFDEMGALANHRAGRKGQKRGRRRRSEPQMTVTAREPLPVFEKWEILARAERHR
jgi:hypothetical protein